MFECSSFRIGRWSLMGVAKIQISHRHVCCVRARWRGRTVIRCQRHMSAYHPNLVFGSGAAKTRREGCLSLSFVLNGCELRSMSCITPSYTLSFCMRGQIILTLVLKLKYVYIFRRYAQPLYNLDFASTDLILGNHVGQQHN